MFLNREFFPAVARLTRRKLQRWKRLTRILREKLSGNYPKLTGNYPVNGVETRRSADGPGSGGLGWNQVLATRHEDRGSKLAEK